MKLTLGIESSSIQVINDKNVQRENDSNQLLYFDFRSIFDQFYINASYIFLSKIDAHVTENSPKPLSKAFV